MNKKRAQQQGGISISVVIIIVLTVLLMGAIGYMIYLYPQYIEYKNAADGKVKEAVAKAVAEQSDKDTEKFRKEENQPYRQFVGPTDYGRVTFMYSKQWSVYEATDVSKGGGSRYEAYLSRIVVPPVGNDSQKFALRVMIEQNQYDTVLQGYSDLIKKGKLTSKEFNANGHAGTRLDGAFSETIRGAAVVMKIRDKTLTIRTDSDVFKPEFEELIKTINYQE